MGNFGAKKKKFRHFYFSQYFRTDLYFDIKNTQWPIVYRKEYNVHFLGLEKLHPFDAHKWGNIFRVSIVLSEEII